MVILYDRGRAFSYVVSSFYNYCYCQCHTDDRLQQAQQANIQYCIYWIFEDAKSSEYPAITISKRICIQHNSLSKHAAWGDKSRQDVMFG